MQMGAQIVVETAQNILPAIDQRHLGPKPVENARELDGDIAAALDQNARGQFFQMKRLVRRDDVFDPRDLGTKPRRGAGGDEDVPRPDFFAGREETHGMCVLQHGAAFDDLDACPFERRGVGELEARDFPVLVGDEARPVEHGFVERPTVTRRVLELVRKARGVDEQLFGNAAADHASAADTVLLGHHDTRAITGSDPRGAHAARACSDH